MVESISAISRGLFADGVESIASMMTLPFVSDYMSLDWNMVKLTLP